jgi:phage-related protein
MDKKITVVFYQTPSGNEPVREWLKSLSIEDRQNIGNDIKTVEYGWPIGMPVSRPLGNKLYEVRSSISDKRIARVILPSSITIWFFLMDLSKRLSRLQKKRLI